MGVSVAGGMLSMMLGFDPFAGPVDIHLMAQMLGGRQTFWTPCWDGGCRTRRIWCLGAWARRRQSTPRCFRLAMGSGVMPGMYYAYVVVVPAGMNPVIFDPASSPYYLWCFNQMLL